MDGQVWKVVPEILPKKNTQMQRQVEKSNLKMTHIFLTQLIQK